jgi:hypothetical protein
MKEIIEKYKKHLQENGLAYELFKWDEDRRAVLKAEPEG